MEKIIQFIKNYCCTKYRTQIVFILMILVLIIILESSITSICKLFFADPFFDSTLFWEQSFLFWPEKFVSICIYLLQLVVIGVGGLLFFCLKRFSCLSFHAFAKPWVLLYYLILIPIILIFSFFNFPYLLLLWMILFVVPFCTQKRLVMMIIVMSSCILTWYAYVFFIQKPYIINSWYGYPETVLVPLVNGEQKSYQWADLMEKYQTTGIMVYRPTIDMGKNPVPFPEIKQETSDPVRDAERLSINRKDFLIKFFYKEKLKRRSQGEIFFELFDYFDHDNHCIIKNSATVKIIGDSIYFDKNNAAVKIIGNSIYFNNVRVWEDSDVPICEYYKDSLKNGENFIKIYNISPDNYWKQADRFIFHHHNFLLGSAHELALGRDKSKVNTQYGYGHTYLVWKILDSFGGLNYLSYFRMLYASYFVYFIFAVLMFFLITRNWKLTSVLSIAYLITLNLQGWPFTMIAPGLAPGRHFWDLITLFFLWKTYQVKKWGPKIIAATAFFAFFIIALWHDISFGTLLGCAIVGGLTMSLIVFYKKSWQTILLLCGSFGLIVVMFLGTKSPNALGQYYAKGLVGIPESVTVVILFLILFTLLFFLILQVITRLREEHSVLLIILNLYCFGFFTYYLWSSDPWHLIHCLPVFIFFVLFLLDEVLKIYPEKLETLKKKTTIVFEMGLLLFMSVSFFWQVYSYYINIYLPEKTRLVENWKNPRLPIKMSAEEKLFADAVSLVNKYTPEEQKGIAIFSRIDNVLPFAANKYSDLPYPDLQWFLLSPKEETVILNYFKEMKPQYIFVDTDVERNFECDRPFCTSKQHIWNEYFIRIARLNLLKNVWQKIKKDYEIKEKTPLITVWERKKK